jgi:hypothetical protein
MIITSDFLPKERLAPFHPILPFIRVRMMAWRKFHIMLSHFVGEINKPFSHLSLILF